MEVILIATDFSPAARNATIYGFEFAKSIGAKVILLTIYKPSLALPDSNLYVSPEELEKTSYQLLFEEANAIDPMRTVLLETQSRQGPINDSILAAATDNNVSYIIVGMKAQGKEFRKYFGTTVTQLCKTSNIPLIVVPAQAVYTAPKKIALASDVTEDMNITILYPLKKIAQVYDSRLLIVRVIKEHREEAGQRDKDDERNWFLQNIDHGYEFIKAERVAKALNDFVDKRSINMLAVVPHQHSLFERLFTRSVTKDLVFNSIVPLLILTGKNTQSNAETMAGSYNEELLFNIN